MKTKGHRSDTVGVGDRYRVAGIGAARREACGSGTEYGCASAIVRARATVAAADNRAGDVGHRHRAVA